jgi:hypothetical protein
MPRALVNAVALAALGALGALGGACRDPRLEELQAIRHDVCACKTSACAEAAMKRVPAGDVRSDHVAQKVARDMMKCLSELYDSERPAAGPDAEAPPADPPATPPAAPSATPPAAPSATPPAAPSAAPPAAAPATPSATPAAVPPAAPPATPPVTPPAGSAPTPAARPRP